MASICAPASPLKWLSAILATTRGGEAGTGAGVGESFSAISGEEKFAGGGAAALALAFILAPVPGAEPMPAAAACILFSDVPDSRDAVEAERETGAVARPELAGNFSARKSESTCSRGARRAAFTKRKRPNSRCKRGSGLRRKSSSVDIKIWKKRVRSSSLKFSACFARRGRCSRASVINGESAPATLATSKLRRWRMDSRQKCCKL